ncbi:uncharacterized protein LOC134271839 [Saccostrea cucullata]|uniref:uncharacterized protein LOC134271839 n=1 Tax=Saccostrea cuccullata TaxID=36930 RepID=UPI002ED35E4F
MADKPDPGEPDPGNIEHGTHEPAPGETDPVKHSSILQDDERVYRHRQKTTAGQDLYLNKIDDYQRKLSKLWRKMEDSLILIDQSKDSDLKKLRKIEDDLIKLHTKYSRVSEEYLSYLKRHSDRERLEKTSHDLQRKEGVIDSVLKQMENLKLEAAEHLSQRMSEKGSSHGSSIGSQIDKKEWTENYVTAHFSGNLQSDNIPKDIELPPNNLPPINPLSFESPREKLNVQATPKPEKPYMLNPLAPSFVPDLHLSETKKDDPMLGGLVQFLLKKDLLLTRFSKFTDNPEQYTVWKTSFKNIVKELNVSAFEEMDLLVKWLGPTSANFASSIRASNVHSPERGLRKIWERLQERYGRPEMVEAALKKKLDNFPKLTTKDMNKLYDLLDILSELESTKCDEHYSHSLSYFDTSTGIIPIVNKLPYALQEKWTNRAATYKKQYGVPFPPLTFFIDFVRDMSQMKNDPAFMYESSRTSASSTPKKENKKDFIVNRKTYVQHETMKRCPIHKAEHSLLNCRQFLSRTPEDQRKFLKEKHICFKCCESTSHGSRDCKVKVKCEKCGSTSHRTLMHFDRLKKMYDNPVEPTVEHGGESQSSENVSSKCTVLCDKPSIGRSCGKIVLVNVCLQDQPSKVEKVYAILDDQSNRTLISPSLCDRLNVHGPSTQYLLSSCAGTTTMAGRRIDGLRVESVSNSYQCELPVAIECDEIPNERSEIPTPDVAFFHKHLNAIAHQIPSFEENVKIELLIGRDVPEVHHVLDQITGPRGAPFAQKLGLGWVIIGDVCLGKVHEPDHVNVMKTSVLSDGRVTQFEPCENHFHVKEFHTSETCDYLFHRSRDDDKLGLSVEDRKFLSIMDQEFQRDQNGKWIAPLPFRSPRPVLPNNRPQAWRRAQILDASLQRDEVKRTHFIEFMKKVLDSGAAEVAPTLGADKKEVWYLPIFGVYHPKKPNQVRGVFDSSAVYEGISLNKVLMKGPDLTNSLLGILIRFRKDKYAVIADIEQMFYQFYVKEEQRDFLRFFWYKDNNPELPLIEYRMCVHVFGNAPSPAIATYGLRKVAENCIDSYGSDVNDFVLKNFYVDDGLVSAPSREKVLDLVLRTKTALHDMGKIRLHKIASNDWEILNSFCEEDLNKNLKDIQFGENTSVLPIQHSLGLSWDLNTDCFVFQIQEDEKPHTRRGMLSFLNSIFDPLGFLSPITIAGKILLRETTGIDWDQPLPTSLDSKWKDWKTSLKDIHEQRIPRMYLPVSLSDLSNVELHVFSDASEKAIAAAAYLKVVDADNNTYLGFILGKSKLAPVKGHTIPRLELCGAVLASEIGNSVLEQLDMKPSVVKYYTDSKVVLGYLHNETKRFYTYVSNRVCKILKRTSAEQWNYVPSSKNPADCATRENTSCEQLTSSEWLQGPRWLLEQCNDDETIEDLQYPLIDAEDDKEIRPEVKVTKTTVETSKKPSSLTELCEKYSDWRTLIKSIAIFRHIVQTFKHKLHHVCSGWHVCRESTSVQSCQDAEKFLLRELQKQFFSKEIQCLKEKSSLPKNSTISALCPFLDGDDLLRVGGRLNNVKHVLPTGEINPIIVPKNHHITTLLVRFYHESVRHQGRHITEGALRQNGFWLISAKRTVSSYIHKCVTCKKLRGKLEYQKMADLPCDRLTSGPPFTSVGIDTFGPWKVVARRTRGGVINSKRWAIIFSCLSTRAVHIEIIEEMSSSSFINALRRFESLRGPVKVFRSDRGTNFVGATDELGIQALNVEDGPISNYLNQTKAVWIFNSPHSSHMGGSWERMIGLTRRILDSMLLDPNAKQLTHESLTTFMAEVCAIMNSRPLVPISTDPESTLVLSPAMLLTGKVNFLPVLPESVDTKDMYRAQWKHVQVLSDIFWKHWRQDYLHNLQYRRKWRDDQPNLKIGDVILLKDAAVNRVNWPLGVITETFESSDGKVRKARVRVRKDGQNVIYTRPVCEMVFLTRG